MKIGPFTFPDHGGNTAGWQRHVIYHALARNILAVAATRITGHWSAYIHATPGQNHDNEIADVLAHGTKLSEKIARAIFPELYEVPYAK